MAEEQVVLTASLQDELTAPLDRAKASVEDFTKKVEEGNRRQSRATQTATTSIDGSLSRQKRMFGGLPGVFSKVSSSASSMFSGVGGKVSSALANVKSRAVAQFDSIKDAAKAKGEQSGSAFSNGMKSAIGAGLALVSAGAIAAFANSTVAAFSELEDSTAAAGVVFGDSMGIIIDQSKAAAGTLGLSEQAVINAANTFGTYGKSAGLAGGDLAGFSTEMTTLAGDLASFKGTTTEQSIEAIGSALRGEMEPIRAYGVLLDDATLKAEAMAMGLITTEKDALTPANKVLAAQSAILKQTTDAQGDFARTSTSTANVQKTLAAETENLRAKLGTFLAPAFTAVRLKATDAVRGISGFLDKVMEAQAVSAAGGTTGAIAGALGLGPRLTGFIAEALGSINALKAGIQFGFEEGNTGGVAGGFFRIGGAIKSALDVARGVKAGFMMPPEVAASYGAGLAPVLAFGVKIREMVDRVKEGFAGLGGGGSIVALAGSAALLIQSFGGFTPIITTIVAMFMRFAPLAGQLGGALKFLLGPIGILGALFIAAYATSEPFRVAIQGLLTAVMGLVTQLAGALVPVFTTLVTTLLPVIMGLFTALVPVFIQVVTAVLPLVTMLVGQLAPILTSLISAVLPIVLALFTQLVPIFMQLVAAVLPVAMTLIELLVPILMQLISAVLPIVIQLITSLAPIFVQLLGAVMPILEPIANLAATLLGLAMDVITPLMPLVTGIAELLSGVLGGAIDLLMPLVEFLIEKFVGLVDFLVGPLTSAIGGISGLFSGIGDVVSSVAGAVGDFFGSVGDFFGGGASGGAVLGASGGAVTGFSGGGVAKYAGGGGTVLGGYSPGRDTIPAILSPGESVLVPELTRAIGPQNIMAANAEASGGRPAGAGPRLSSGYSAGSGGSGGVSVTVGDVSVTVQGETGLSGETIAAAVQNGIEQAFAEARKRDY